MILGVIWSIRWPDETEIPVFHLKAVTCAVTLNLQHALPSARVSFVLLVQMGKDFLVLYFKTAHFPDCDRTDTKRNVWHRKRWFEV